MVSSGVRLQVHEGGPARLEHTQLAQQSWSVQARHCSQSIGERESSIDCVRGLTTREERELAQEASREAFRRVVC